VAFLDPAKAGLAVRYSDWPGATQIVIPLNDSDSRDVLGMLSTSEIASRAVIDRLKEGEDKGIAERAAIADLKEREIEKGKEAVCRRESDR